MDKFVACLYIQDYREKIAAEADEAQRQKLLRLLAEEEAKLAAIEARERKSRASRKELSTPANMSVSRQSACLASASIHPLRIRRHGKTRACGRRGLIGPAPVTVEPVQSILVANPVRNLDPLHRLGCFDLRSTNYQGLLQDPVAARGTD
jgi:hypothetical protein